MSAVKLTKAAKLSSRQWAVLKRLLDADFIAFNGHNAGAAYALSKLGLAEYVGPDKWTGVIYRITDAGRAALAQEQS